MTQLNEAKEQVKPGITKVTGSYGKEYDAGEDGAKKPASDIKKGRGRPKKDADETGEVKKYDTKSLGNVFGGGQKPNKEIGKVSKKHSLKEYFDQLDKALNEAEQIQIKPASQVPQKPGQSSMVGQQQQVAGQANKNTQVIQQGDKTLGTVDNPQLAQQIKQSIGKGEMTLMPDGTMEEGIVDTVKQVGGKVLDKLGHSSDEDLIRDLQKKAGVPVTGVLRTTEKPEQQVNEKDIGKHNNATTGFDALVKKLTPKYGVEAAKRIAGSQLKKIKEADLPSNDADMGAGLGAGRSQATFEGKKPDFPDIDNDKDTKESIAKAAADKKKMKTKVKEGMESRLKAAHHRGKAHALAKESYNCKYDDMEESRMYHEGFKEGLDECYGQMPIQGYVGEETPSDVVDDMASYGAYDDVDEGNAFTGALAKTPAGQRFSVGGKTFTDTSNLDEMDSVFESWNTELNSLLKEYQGIQEGMTVSISKGQQGQPDSVSVSAQDGEADQLLSIIKQAGLGLFGGDDAASVNKSSAMSLQPTDAGSEEGNVEIGVVDDHDGMMDLIKKVTGGAPETPKLGFDASSSDSAEENCEDCGMAESDCGCDHEAEQVDEVESEDQMEYEVAEDNAPDSGAEETEAEDTEIAADNAAASSHGGAENSNIEEEDELEESYANSADDTFETDIAFMTKVISGGLNKQKSTGQTTIPVVAGQDDRMGYSVNESTNDWKKLAGIK